MWGTSPDGAHPGLHSKPLDAAIGRVHAPYRPGGHHGQRIRSKNTKHSNKTQLLTSNYGTATIGAEELAVISSYQTFSADKK
jgi:hypothetical protein